MSKFLIVPEPHISSNNIKGRLDYLGEIKGYMNEVHDIVVDEKECGYLVFPGDVFDRGFNNIDEYFYWIDWFSDMDKILAERGGCIYSAVGNHELSFSKSNPFWRFTSTEDKGFNTLCDWNTKAAMPKGSKSYIHVEDVVELDNVTVFFCHYDKMSECKELVIKHTEEYADTKKRICVCHNSIISGSIARVLRDNYERDPLTHYIAHENIESMDFFHLFDMVFNGHMHKAYSRFKLENEENGKVTNLLYLASLGRTNSEEINDTDLIRTLPLVDTLTGNVEAYTIELKSRSETLTTTYDLNKEEVKHTKEDYENVCRNIVDIGDPMKELMQALTDRDMIVALECAKDGVRPKDFVNLINSAERLG